MTGFDRIIAKIGNLCIGDSILNASIQYLNRRFPRYKWKEEFNNLYESFIVQTDGDTSTRVFRHYLQDGWKTKLATFLENIELLEKLELLDE